MFDGSRLTGPKGPSDAPVTVEWQDRVTRPAAGIFAIGGLLLAGIIIIQDRGAVGPRGAVVLSCLAVLAIAWLRRIAWRPIAALLVLTLTVIGFVFPSQLGLRFSPMLVAMLAVTVAASLLSRRAAWVVIGVTCLGLVGTGYGVARGWFVIEAPTQALSGQWARAAVLFALVSAALTVVVSGVVRSLESSLQATRVALDRLVQSEERLGLALRAADDGLWDWHLGMRRCGIRRAGGPCWDTTPANCPTTARSGHGWRIRTISSAPTRCWPGRATAATTTTKSNSGCGTRRDTTCRCFPAGT